MDVVLLTIGDELLAGDTENTNATWLARELTERGASLRRVLTIPDDRELIARYVREWGERFDAVLTTGGLGGTHDDVTMAAVADGVGRELVINEEARTALEGKVERFREEHPEYVAEHDFEFDVEAAARLPAGGEAIVTEAGWSPACVVENVYVFPGIPEEMHAAFERVADDFGGEAVSTTLYTPAPEGAITADLGAIQSAFDVRIGSYPTPRGKPTRLKVTGTDADAVAAAADELRGRLDTVPAPEPEPGSEPEPEG